MLWSSSFIIATNTVVFLEMTGSLNLRKSLPNIQVWITIVCLSFILASEKWHSWRKQLVQGHKCRRALCVLTICQKKKKSNKITCIQELRLNKINNFYLFIKDILRWTWIFSKHRVWGAGWLPAQFGATVSTYTKAPGVYPLLHDEKN